MNIHFQKASFELKDTIFGWLDEPHMQEFWDNSPEHRDDILNFMGGRVTPSPYHGGLFDYWVGTIDGAPYCIVMTHEEHADDVNAPEPFKPYLSAPGETYSLDFGIGNPDFVGKGLASHTLKAFVDFFVKDIDPRTKRFLIDPGTHNPRAIHVYQKAGFQIVSEFKQEGGYFDQGQGVLMLREI